MPPAHRTGRRTVRGTICIPDVIFPASSLKPRQHQDRLESNGSEVASFTNQSLNHAQDKSTPGRDEVPLLPPLDAETYAGLKANIAINGVQVPIVRDEKGYILDGFARAKIAKELGYEFPSVREGIERAGEAVPGPGTEPGTSAPGLPSEEADHRRRDQGKPWRSNRWIARSLGVHHATVIA